MNLLVVLYVKSRIAAVKLTMMITHLKRLSKEEQSLIVDAFAGLVVQQHSEASGVRSWR